MAERGPVVIDWIDATLGMPLADVARTAILIEGELVPGRSPSRLARIGLRWASRAYLRHYFPKTNRRERELFPQWRPLVAAGRLSEGIEDLNPWLHAQVKAALGETAGN